MQARYYEPVIGRFYSNDPVSAVAHLGTANDIHGFNRYAYANNNPYRFVEYRDTDTGESRIIRGGPSQSYPGGASDAFEITEEMRNEHRFQYVDHRQSYNGKQKAAPLEK